MCKLSVQGERARGEVLYMGMGGCCVVPIGSCFASYEWWQKFNRDRWPGVGVGGCKCARRVCKVSVQGGKSFIWEWGALLQLPLVSLVSMGGGTKAVGKSGLGGVCECAT